MVNQDNKRFDLTQFGRNLTKSYARNMVVEQFSTAPDLADFDLTNEEVNDKGETVLTFQHWA